MFIPMSINSETSRFLVVGGGKIALKKIQKLLAFRAQITLVSPVIDHALEPLKEQIEWITSRYDEAFLDAADYVIAATNDKALNQTIQKACKERGIACLNVSNGKASDFQIPAVVTREPVHISISTQGLSPGMSKELKRAIEGWIDDEWADRTIEMAAVRAWLKEHVADRSERERILRELVKLPLLDLKRRRQNYEDSYRDKGE